MSMTQGKVGSRVKGLDSRICPDIERCLYLCWVYITFPIALTDKPCGG